MNNNEFGTVFPKTEITVSLDFKVVGEIRRKAVMEGTSMNSKVNSILNKHEVLYKPSEERGCIFVPQRIHLLMIEAVNEDKLTEVMLQINNNEIPSLFSSKGITPSLETLIDMLYERMFLWSGMYSNFTHYQDNEGYSCLVFDHKYTIKWSRVLAKVFSQQISSMLTVPPPEAKIWPNSIFLKIKNH